MSPTEQVEVFKKLFGSSRFQAVLQYFCGFTKLANIEMQKFIFFLSAKQVQSQGTSVFASLSI